MARYVVLTFTTLYFASWAYFSHWDTHLMLFWENDIRATAARLGVGFLLLLASTLTFTAHDH